jgi:hypothetical protein
MYKIEEDKIIIMDIIYMSINFTKEKLKDEVVAE